MSIGQKFSRLTRRIGGVAHAVTRLDRHIEDIKIGEGRIAALLGAQHGSPHLRDYEFKVFSQWGEDGIIQRLVSLIEIPHKTFIEFGVEDFWESNCRFLMMKDNWSGFVVDGSQANVDRIRAQYYFWRYDLTAETSFVTPDNVEAILEKSGFDHDLGLLSVDIDGMDYHVLEAITTYRPRILVCEYNSLFGSDRPVTVPRDDRFLRAEAHPSRLYFGCSIAALDHLARGRGYSLVAGSSEGLNAFFVRSDLLGDALKAITPAEAYRPSKFRESTDSQGNPSFLGMADRRALVSGLPMVNVVTGATETL